MIIILFIIHYELSIMGDTKLVIIPSIGNFCGVICEYFRLLEQTSERGSMLSTLPLFSL